MFGLIRRLFFRDFGPPPSPDVTHQPSFSGQRIVEMIYSDSKGARAIITIDDTGLYRIIVQCWDTGDWREWQKAFWYGDGSSSHTDTLARAHQLAVEALRCARHHA